MNIGLLVFVLAAWGGAPGIATAQVQNARSQAPCASLQVPDQKLDEDSVRRVERDWLVSELRGDSARVGCLLEANYTEISLDGSLHTKADILEHAAKHKGSNDPIPTITLTIIVHGQSATAYAIQTKHDEKGQEVKVFFADSFGFHDGGWHPYFSMQAAAANGLKIQD